MNTTIKSFRDLIVWQVSHELAMDVFNFSKNARKTQLNYEIFRQALRSAFSVPANIVEGFIPIRERLMFRILRLPGDLPEKPCTGFWFLVRQVIFQRIRRSGSL